MFDRSFLANLDRSGLRRALWLLRRQDARPSEINPAAAQPRLRYSARTDDAVASPSYWKTPRRTSDEKS